MKFIKKHALPFLVVFSSGLGLANPSFAQHNSYPHVTSEARDILIEQDELIREMARFGEIVERQHQLRYPCSQGNENACAEIQQLDREIEAMIQR